MAQPAPKLRLVAAPSTGYARKAWISHIIETAPKEVGGIELAVLKELADLVDDATGWAEASYQKLAFRTRLSERTVRRAIKVLCSAGLIEPELIGGRAGEGRARIRYRFPSMHAWLAKRREGRLRGQSDHGQADHGQRVLPTLVRPSENPPPFKELKQEPCAHAREGMDLDGVKTRLEHVAPPLARALAGCELHLTGRVLWVFVPPPLEGALRASEGRLRSTVQQCGLVDLRLGRISERPKVISW